MVFYTLGYHAEWGLASNTETFTIAYGENYYVAWGESADGEVLQYRMEIVLTAKEYVHLMPLFALIQPDEQNRAVPTLLLSNEVSTTIMSMK